MEEDIKGAIERLSKAQNDIWYATLYSQEEQDEDIKILIKGYRELNDQICFLTGYDWKDIQNYFIPKSKVKEIRDKAEVMDYYVLSDVIEDLNKLLGDEE